MMWRGALLAVALLDGRMAQTVRTAYPDGRVRTVREYRAGREQGRHEGWWSNGTRQFVLNYEGGLLEGEAREWYPNGSLYRLSTYRRGHEEGPQRLWNPDGTLRASYDVRDGRRYGNIGAVGCTPGDSAK